MEQDNFQFVLNDHFILRHCTAREGNDTPSDFRCRQGLRRWSRFFYLDRGQITFVSHTGKQLEIGSGDILFLPYDIEYASSWTDSRDGHYFSVEFILEYPDGRKLDLCEDLTCLIHDSGLFRELFREMARTAGEETPGVHLRCQEQFMHLLYRIATQLRSDRLAHSDIRAAIAQIEEHISAPLDVNALSRDCHMSPATFRRKFLRQVGMSPVEYRNRLRLHQARELLRTGLYTVGEAAERVGIPDLCYFSKQYKKMFGLPPSREKLSE